MKPSTTNLENSVGPSFAVRQGNSLFIPYGEFKHRRGMQRVNETAAGRMSRALSGFAATVRRVVTGESRRLPIYIGHPDVPGRGAEFPDKKSYGWIESITAENDGMSLGVKWTDKGRALIEDGEFLYYSPYWEAELIDGAVLPVEMLSVGLTNNPNIPVPSLANDGGEEAAESESTEPEEEAMKKELAALLGKSEDTTEADLIAEVTALVKSAKSDKDDDKDKDPPKKEVEEKDPPKKEEEDPDKDKDKDALENDATVLAMREERVGSAVDALCLSGKIAIADRESVTKGLLACENDADYGAELEKLAAGKSSLKTKSVTDDLATDGAKVRTENDATARREKREDLMDKEMKRNGGNFNNAWATCSRKNPELF